MTTAPQMLPGLFSGAILSFIEIINELSCSMILYTGKTQTIAVAIFNSLFRDAYGTAAALATILTVVTVLALMLFNKLTGGKGYVS
jgi:iron(III) transport system permease protein